jgi:hypothetical protein
VGRSIPVTVGDRQFSSKGEASSFFKDMLNRYRPGARVVDADAAVLASLLQRHTEAKRKIGAGIDHFEVMDGEYGTQCFKVVRVDGTWDDFSYIHCITPKSD